MATSGYTEIKVQQALWMKVYLRFSWAYVSHNVKNNTSTISWKMELIGRDGGYWQSDSGVYEIIIDGQKYKGSVSFSLGSNESKVLKKGSTIIYHNTDGTKSFNYTFSQSFTRADRGVQSGNGSGTLNPIPRPATLNYTYDFTDEANVLIFYSNPYGNAVDSLQACISFTGVKDDIPYRDISKTSTQYTFELTDEERITLRQYITRGDSTTVRFYVRTIIEGETFWNYKTNTFTLVNYTPTLSPRVKDVNARTVELTGNAQTFIKYFSNAEFTTGATARKEAYIENQYTKCGDTVMTDPEGVIEGVESNTFYFSVTDNRGYTTRDALVKKLIPYVKLTAKLTTEEMSANGTLKFTVSGKYFNGSFGAKSNTMEIEYSFRDEYGNYVFDPEGSGWVKLGTVTPTVDSEGNYTYSYTVSGLDYKKRYNFTVNVIDELSPIQTVTKVLATVPIFDWSKDDFRHYTKVIMDNGKAICGTKPDGTVFTALEASNSNGNTVLGYDNYSNASGRTNIYGDTVGIYSNNPILINGREYGANKVLWQGSHYMNASQTANLSEAISAQPNGIVLVFSLYRDGSAVDASFNTFFISKKEVELLPGAPHTFFMMINSGFSVIGAKYLYISDTTITGHDTNSTSGTNNNLTFNNNSFVLRYVIGV